MKKHVVPTLGVKAKITSADDSTGLFELEVEMPSAPKPWRLTKRYADFFFFNSKLPETTTTALAASAPFPEHATAGAATSSKCKKIG